MQEVLDAMFEKKVISHFSCFVVKQNVVNLFVMK